MPAKRVLPAIALLLVIGLVSYFLLHRGETAGAGLTASGTVEATDAALGFQVPGRVESVRIREGETARRGETLATLDRADLNARLSEAQAQQAAAQALLEEMLHGPRPEELAQAHEADSVATARLLDAQQDYARMQSLLRGNVISQQTFDKSRTNLDVAQSQKHQAEQQLTLVRTGPRPERITAQRAVVAQAEGGVRQVLAGLTNAIVVAPFDGVVTVRNHEPGETVSAGAPVITMSNLADRWVRVYIPEDRIGLVHLGEPATIRTDTYRGKSYQGTVSFISPEAEFTPRNVQTPEERVKLVYAVKVRIVDDAANELKPGMPADVTLTPSS